MMLERAKSILLIIKYKKRKAQKIKIKNGKILKKLRIFH